MSPASAGELIDNRYVVLRELGSGSFGVVYLAGDKATDRNVVLKITRAAEASGGRIVDERASAVLQHPNIVQVLGSGEWHGRTYLVLEYVDGVALKSVLSSGPMMWGDAVTVGIAVAHALEYAHSKGIIHRDVKPSNVLIPVRDGVPQFAQAKLSDFGVLGILGADALTRAGTVMGTPYFMAPEQLTGAANSAATDVYGLGTLLYRMVYGERPFQAANLAELMQKVLRDPPAFPGAEGVPPALRDLTEQCLAKDPQRRPTMLEVSRLLPSLVSSGRADYEPEALVPPPLPAPSEDLMTAHDGPTVIMGEAPPARRPLPLGLLLGLAALSGAAVAAIVMGKFATRAVLSAAPAIGAAILLPVAGFAVAYWIRRAAAERRPGLKADARNLLFAPGSRQRLSDTIATQIEEMRAMCKRVDESVLVSTVAYMYDEFRKATDSKDRQAALMNFVDLVDKVSQRLAPWYVRYEKAFTAAATLVGVGTGLLSLASAVTRLASGKP